MCMIQDCNIVEIGYTTLNNATNERRFNRNVYINCNELLNYFQGRAYLDCYYSAYLYNTDKISEAELYGSLYLDFDDQENLNNAREDVIRTLSFFKIVYQIPNDQIRIYFSGHKGFHMVIPGNVLGIEPDKNLNNIFKHIAEQVKSFSEHKTIDLGIYDNRRLFRMPNTINSKTGLYKIMITSNELYELTENDIKKLAEKPRKLEIKTRTKENPIAHSQYIQIIKECEEELKNTKKYNKNFKHKKTLSIVPECIKNILENGAEEGTRNITIACLTSFYKEYGKTLDEIIDILVQWNSRNTSPTPYRELQTTVKSIFYSDKTYGCNTFKTITKCDPSKCKLILKSKNNSTKRRNNSYGIPIP